MVSSLWIARKNERKCGRHPCTMVVFHNDDYTTMDFVASTLVTFFNYSFDAAWDAMMKVHEQGSAVAGIYTRDIAETKSSQVVELARRKGYPFKVTTEPYEE